MEEFKKLYITDFCSEVFVYSCGLQPAACGLQPESKNMEEQIFNFLT